jgi:hypothetical protein
MDKGIVIVIILTRNPGKNKSPTFLSYDAKNNSSIFSCISWDNVFTGPLPNNYKGETSSDIQTNGGFKKYAVRMVSFAMI